MKHLLLPVSVFLVTFVVFYPFSQLNVHPHNDGIMLKPALDVLSGQIIFRDTFSQYGGTPWIQAVFMWILGPTLKAQRISAVFAYSTAAAFLFMSWRLLLPLSLAISAWIIWIFSASFYIGPFFAWSSVYALAFQAATLFALGRCLQEMTPSRLQGKACLLALLVGILCFLTFLCRQSVGMVTLLAISAALAVFTLLNRKRRIEVYRLFSVIAGFTISFLIFVVYLASHQALSSWYYQTYTWPRIWLTAISSGDIPSYFLLSFKLGTQQGAQHFLIYFLFLAPLFFLCKYKSSEWMGQPSSRLITVLYYLGMVILFFQNKPRIADSFYAMETLAPGAILLYALGQSFVFFWAPKQVTRFQLLVFGFSAVCLASCLQYFPVRCRHHSFWGVSPCIGLFLYLVYQSSGKKQLAVLGILSLLFYTPFINRVYPAIDSFRQWPTTITGIPVLNGMRVKTEELEDWHLLYQAVQKHVKNGQPILVEGPDALYATLVPNQSHPGPFYIKWPGLISKSDERLEEHFVSKTLPLIFMQQPPSPSLQETLDANGYKSVVKIRTGELFVPSI